MKIYFCKTRPNPVPFIILLITLISFKSDFLKAEYLSEELQIDNTTKANEDRSAIPTNPFEIVEMIRRNNMLNDATNPSDAIDDALESFNNLEEN